MTASSDYPDPNRRKSPIVGDLRLDTPPTEPPAKSQGGPPKETLGGQTRPRSRTRAKPKVADLPVAILIELNLRFPGGLPAVTAAFFATWCDLTGGVLPESGPPEGVRLVSAKLYQVVLSRARLADLVEFDREEQERGRPPTIFKAWPDYVLEPHIDRSAPTVKADAAWRSYSARGKRIVWAVIDSGIQADHPHFAAMPLSGDEERRDAVDPHPTASAAAKRSRTFGLHRDFTDLVKVELDEEGNPPPGPKSSPLTDEDGHGTHVAGIIGGFCPDGRSPQVATSDEPSEGAGFVARTPTGQLAGMAPECELVSLKVMRPSAQGNLVTSSAAVIRALEYVRTEANGDGGLLRIHGVNLSLGSDWDPTHYAAGQSPLCQAVNALVASGVVVVISTGNGGGATAQASSDTVGVLSSITEPAHAEDCIAVGSTHREAPHVFGVTWSSSKGPTLDGRAKPDVVAPGEWITSAATGKLRARSGLDDLPKATKDRDVTYAEDSGTSMAAPHVSGVIAAFLSARPEFVGRPREIKRLLCDTATDLGRERYAQGHGLVDLMRMLSNS